MQGSNNSRIGMSNQRNAFDDANWGGGKKNTRGNKSKNSQKQQIRQSRQQVQNQKVDSDSWNNMED